MMKSLQDSLLFAGIAKKYVEQFLQAFPEVIHIKKGEYLCHQDDIGDCMYLLESGRLDVLLDHTPDDHQSGAAVAVIESGAVIGEICVFGQKKRTASIRATMDSTLIQIDGIKFRQHIENQEIGFLLISFNIAKSLSQRLADANDFIRKLHLSADQGVVKSELAHYRQRFFDESLFN